MSRTLNQFAKKLPPFPDPNNFPNVKPCHANKMSASRGFVQLEVANFTQLAAAECCVNNGGDLCVTQHFWGGGHFGIVSRMNACLRIVWNVPQDAKLSIPYRICVHGNFMLVFSRIYRNLQFIWMKFSLPNPNFNEEFRYRVFPGVFVVTIIWQKNKICE